MKNLSRSLIVGLAALLLAACHTTSGPATSWSAFGNSDAALTASVSTSLMSNPQLAGLPIQVESSKGTVRLTGYVKTIRQSDVAGDAASRVDGVKLVENNLIVRK